MFDFFSGHEHPTRPQGQVSVPIQQQITDAIEALLQERDAFPQSKDQDSALDRISMLQDHIAHLHWKVGEPLDSELCGALYHTAQHFFETADPHDKTGSQEVDDLPQDIQ